MTYACYLAAVDGASAPASSPLDKLALHKSTQKTCVVLFSLNLVAS